MFLFLHAYSLTHADADADADGDTAVEDAAMMTRDNARYVVLLASICLFVSYHILLLRVSLPSCIQSDPSLITHH